MIREILIFLLFLGVVGGFFAVLAIAVFAPGTHTWSLPATLGIVVFAIMLNGELYGVKTPILDAVLVLLLIGLLIWAAVLFGWRTGLLYLVGSFIFGIPCLLIVKPLAYFLRLGRHAI